MHHYTYLLINTATLMMYIGKRSCNCVPELDTGYKGSSKYVPKTECVKVILKTFLTAKEALEHEIKLHNIFNVAVNSMFYNKAKQTSTKFDTTGTKVFHSDAMRRKLSSVKAGVVPNWSEEGKKVVLHNLTNGRTAETRAKAAKALALNGSNKGIKNSQFKPWYISTSTVTHLFYNISKSELSIQQGHYAKYYADLQKKFNKNKIVTTKLYGTIIDMGFLKTV